MAVVDWALACLWKSGSRNVHNCSSISGSADILLEPVYTLFEWRTNTLSVHRPTLMCLTLSYLMFSINCELAGFDARRIYGYNMPVSVSRSLFFCVER